MTEMNTAEVATEEVIQTEEVQSEAVTETVEETTEELSPDVAEILDNIFKSMEAEPAPQEEKSFWPNISGVTHESEAKVLLDNMQKELEEKLVSEQEARSKSEELAQELEALRIEQEEAKENLQRQTSDIETYEEFYKTLADVPVLWELVKMVAEKWPESVNIPKYLNKLVESRIMAQDITPKTTEAIAPTPVAQTQSFEDAIRRRNKR